MSSNITQTFDTTGLGQSGAFGTVPEVRAYSSGNFDTSGTSGKQTDDQRTPHLIILKSEFAKFLTKSGEEWIPIVTPPSSRALFETSSWTLLTTSGP